MSKNAFPKTLHLNHLPFGQVSGPDWPDPTFSLNYIPEDGMSLRIFTEPKQAARVYGKAISIKPARQLDVDMGGYAVASDINERTALGTSGAGPCVIIAIHKSKGIGALGHYAADNNPTKIVAGVGRMVAALGGPFVQGIFLAAGQVADGLEQMHYENTVRAGIRNLALGAMPRWVKPDDNDSIFGACYYLPFTQELAFSEFQIGGGLSAVTTNKISVSLRGYS